MICSLSLVVAFAGTGRSAWGAEDERTEPTLIERIATFVAETKAFEREKALDDLKRAIATGGSLLREVLADEGLADRDRTKAAKDVVGAVGGLADFSDETVARAAVTALGVMEHEEGLRYLKRYLRPSGDEAPEPIVNDAIAAAGQIRNDAAVPLLLRMVEKSDHSATAASAMRALSNFGDSKRYRKKILVDLCSYLRRHQPGTPVPGKENQATGGYIPGKNGSDGGNMWSAMAGVLPATLNALTGQNVATATDWFNLVQDNKRDLDSLFPPDPEG
jgi:hypothetical protein